MGPEFEKAINELTLRMRLIRAVQEGDSQDSLNEREALILQQLLEREAMTVSEIAESWPDVRESTISLTITRLWREKAMVSKTINPQNQRVTIVKLTEKGKQEIRRFLNQQGERLNALLNAIDVTPEEKEVMIRICNRGSRYLDQYLGAIRQKTN
jgi:DNA-binding MarR family transcriptional regulator